jgi:intergrase/recombinase
LVGRWLYDAPKLDQNGFGDVASVDWSEFKEWVCKKYAKSYYRIVLCYARKYARLLNDNLRDLDLLNPSVKTHAVKSLIVLSKFLGTHKQFKSRLEEYGIKVQRPDAFSSFLRIMNNHNSDLIEWIEKASEVVRPNERLFLKFLLLTGLRASEAIESFNLITRLHKENRLSTYYDEEQSLLQHFQFKDKFIRGTKNAYVSFVPNSLVDEICNSEELTYAQIIKRLRRKGLRLGLNEFRDYFGSFLVRHNLIREEVDLLCGRIPPSIFLRHYWSPSFKELRQRALSGLKHMNRGLGF